MSRYNKDASWYIKWFASIALLIGLSIRVLDLEGNYNTFDYIFTLIGAIGWFITGRLWNDRSIMICNGAYTIVLITTLIITYTGI